MVVDGPAIRTCHACGVGAETLVPERLPVLPVGDHEVVAPDVLRGGEEGEADPAGDFEQGAPLDPRRVLTGLGSTPEPARADVAMTRAVRDAGLAANPRALPSEWVAVPHRGTMGYKGTVVSDDEPPVLVAHVVLGADFKVIAVEPDRREVGGTPTR